MKRKTLLSLSFTLLLCLSFLAIFTPLVHSQSVITRVQGNARGTTATLAIAVTLAQTPQTGNVLIAVIGTFSSNAGSLTVNNITETGVTWFRQINFILQNGIYSIDTEIWAGTVASTSSKSITINLSNNGGANEVGATADICEYSGLNTASLLDQTNHNEANGGDATSTGTTSLTSQNNELFIGAATATNSSQTSPQNNFAILDGAETNSLSVSYLEYIATTKAQAYSGTAISPPLSAPSGWSACIATFEAYVPAYSITITSSPAGSGFITVDGTAITTPDTFLWAQGSTHTVAANSPVSGGTDIQRVFSSWSDSGAQSHTYTVPSSNATVTASFQTQYYLTVSSAYGSPTGQGWYNSGASASFSVTTPVSGGIGTQYVFGNWTGTGTGSYSGTSASDSVTMNNPITETSAWSTQYQITTSCDAHSTISPTSWCNAGSAKTVTYSPSSGYTIHTVIVNGSYSESATGSFTFRNIQSAESIVVSTSSVIYYVTASSDANSIIYPSGRIAVPYGTQATFTCSPNTNYQLSNFYINGSAAGLNVLVNNQYIVSPTGNTTLYLTSVAVQTGGGGGGGSTTINYYNSTAATATPIPVEASQPYNTMFVIGSIVIASVVFLVLAYQATAKRAKKASGAWT
jgi:hypothetical protein